jgi:type VI secretion system secreted protein Hcp
MSNAIYLQLEGIDGESKDSAHDKWIECQSVQWGVGRGWSGAASGTGSHTSGKPSFSEITFTKHLDFSSPKLMEFVASGAVIKTATLHVVKSSGEEKVSYLVYEFTNCALSGYSLSDQQGGGTPTDSFSMAYATFKMLYNQTSTAKDGAEGTVPAGWDLAANVPL